MGGWWLQVRHGLGEAERRAIRMRTKELRVAEVSGQAGGLPKSEHARLLICEENRAKVQKSCHTERSAYAFLYEAARFVRVVDAGKTRRR